jgi:hypothetical protein
MPSIERAPESARGRWRRRVIKAARLSPRDWRVLAEGFGTLLVVAAGARGRSFSRMAAWATRVAPGSMLPATDVARIAWLVGIAARPTGFKCLVRSLTLSRVLARRGVATSVQIGVRQGERELQAHAWVEWKGTVLNDSMAHVREFAALDRTLGAAMNG